MARQHAALTTEELRRAFAQRLGLKMLLDINQLKKTIKDGVTKGTWIYYPSEEGIGYGTVSPAPLIEISENVTLYTPEEAQRVGIKIKGEHRHRRDVSGLQPVSLRLRHRRCRRR